MKSSLQGSGGEAEAEAEEGNASAGWGGDERRGGHSRPFLLGILMEGGGDAENRLRSLLYLSACLSVYLPFSPLFFPLSSSLLSLS